METDATFSTFNWETELRTTKLPHEGYRANFLSICERLEKNNHLSFSAACGPAIRKAANRLFSKSKFNVQSGHINQTEARCKREPVVFVLEDTTDANFKTHSHTEGLGDLGGYGKRELKPGEKRNAGLSIHTAFAITPGREPLGILGQHIWAPVNETRKGNLLRKLPIEEKESHKWHLSLDWVTTALGDRPTQVYKIGDREGDFYEHFAKERPKNIELIIRVLHKQRKVLWNGEKVIIQDLHNKLPCLTQREIVVSARNGQRERKAIVSVYSCEVTVPAPKERQGRDLSLSLVWAVEHNPPAGVEPLDWVIFSTKPVKTLEDALFVLDAYALRWVIERYHYVLKQGLRIERLQFDNFMRLSNAIRLCSLVAWRLLSIAYLCKAKPEAPANEQFDAKDVVMLEKATESKIDSVKQYILALGKLVGFAPSTKQPYPGEKLLWQACQILATMRRGAEIAGGGFHGTG